jgi:hypothetical protein
MRALVTGPARSGKTRVLRQLGVELLRFCASGSRFKEIFIVVFDFERTPITSLLNFYSLISSTVVEALLIQRRDLGGTEVARSLRNAFADLPTVPKMKLLRKPLEFQEHLRRPLSELDGLLARLHEYYNTPNLLEAFLTNVALLPEIIGRLFGFAATFFIIDHIDLADVDLEFRHGTRTRSIQLIEYIKLGISHSQYLLSCKDSATILQKFESNGDYSLDLTQSLTVIPVNDCAVSEFPQKVIVAELNGGVTLRITAEHTHGCPAFVAKFDYACACPTEIKEPEQKEKLTPRGERERIARKRELALIQRKAVEELIVAIFDFEDGVVPRIGEVTISGPDPPDPKPPGDD